MSGGAPDGPAATLYLPAEAYGGTTAEITGDAYRHLFRARRVGVGEVLRVVDGAGHARRAIVAAVGRHGARIELGETLSASEPPLRLTLIVAAPRPERASWLVEKTSELGVAAVRWLRSERAPRRLRAEALERHRRVAVSAMQQSGGALLPEISGPHDWGELEELLAHADLRCALDPAGGGRPVVEERSSVAAVVGPEGGWTGGERHRLADLGCEGWSLGCRTLRVETAAVVAAGVFLSSFEPG